jgi:Tol biopolymer transport system component
MARRRLLPEARLPHDRHVAVLPDRSVRVVAIRGYFPSFAPDSAQLACDEGFTRIVIASLDSRTMRPLLDPAALGGAQDQRAWRPSWSKDGQWIAFTVGPAFAKPDAPADIWKARPDGSGAVNLTAGSGGNDAFPDFSPDGNRVVFRSGRDGNHEIYVIDADGGNPTRLTDHPSTDTMPAFSPDGKQIAFVSDRDGNHEVYLLELGTGGEEPAVRRITDHSGRDTHPKFSPDGNWLVFASERGGLNDEEPLIPIFNPQPYGDIYVVRLADGLVVRLTHNKWEDGTPTWADRH